MLHYLQELFQALDLSSLTAALLRAAAVLLCLTVHETCHGLAALAMGDPTAKRQHRLSFNPLHHIDGLGLLSMLLCGFGWAKPVPVDPRYFKRPKLGMAVTALAGPVSNFLLALLLMFAASLLAGVSAPGLVFSFLLETAVMSVGLGLFNLVPIPPLDGSKILFSFLPERAYNTLLRYERWGMLLLLVIVYLDLGGSYLSNAIARVCYWMAGLFFNA